VDSWLAAVAPRSGPLLTAATHFTASHGVERDPPRGVGGLHTLSTLIERERHNAHDADEPQDVGASGDASDREFIAGAGAYLGLLLLDHLPHGAHVANAGEHRLRLGTDGFFDPFAAVVSALNARDTPRALRALIEAVKCAEDEAAGRGPVARVVRALRRVLEPIQHVRIIEHFDHLVWLDVGGSRTELDLSHVIESTAQAHATDAVLTHSVERLCVPLMEGAAPLLGWETARDLLMPRLVGRSFLNSVPALDDLYLVQLAPEVWETLVLRFNVRSRYVRRTEFEAWSAHPTGNDRPIDPRRQAIVNLAHASTEARFLEHDTPDGPLVVAQSRDNLDATRLLLPGLHDVLARTLGSPFLVATPHRDTLLASALGPAELVTELRARADAATRGARHAISKQLWVVSGPGQFRPYGPELTVLKS
jgi:hypothetical protein